MIPASAQGATKLLEALEKLSQWAGEPSRGGPSGAPSRELVRAFEEALSTAPVEGPAAAAGEGSTAASSAAALLPGPAESSCRNRGGRLSCRGAERESFCRGAARRSRWR